MFVLLRCHRVLGGTSVRSLLLARGGMGMIRRTVWDGSIELGEIQMPDTPTYRESDAEFHPNLTLVSGQKDPHSLFGRAMYTNGAGIDRPLTVTRVAYGEKVGSTHWGFLPFTIVPYWNTRGVAESGGFGNGAQTHCQTISGSNRCVKIEWPGDRFSDRQGKPIPEFWHGNVLNRNEDGGGAIYKRNRYYDTRTGQFTQEDPIGLAGGLNLYGYAAGDPVDFTDPFGLCVPFPVCVLAGAGAGGGAIAVGGGGAAATSAAIAGAGPALVGAGIGVLIDALIQPAFPGDGDRVGSATVGALAAADATAVFNRREARTIRAAIRAVTGEQVTDAQFNCFSEYIHECKEQGDWGTKNDRGDYTFQELIERVREFFGIY